MAAGSSRVVARILSTHDGEFVSLTWEWIIRTDGQVCYRLTELRGRRERNPWRSVTRLGGADLRTFSRDTARAEAWLASLARERGHNVGGQRGGRAARAPEWRGRW
jgi:hypothetical protein